MREACESDGGCYVSSRAGSGALFKSPEIPTLPTFSASCGTNDPQGERTVYARLARELESRGNVNLGQTYLLCYVSDRQRWIVPRGFAAVIWNCPRNRTSVMTSGVCIS